MGSERLPRSQLRFESRGPRDTEAHGAAVAATLAAGDVVLVYGELGAGKTTWVRGACQALGVSEIVRSPTFTVGRRYDGDVPVAHIDLYRLDSLAAEEPGLLEDYLDGARVCFVEWPERGGDELAAATTRVRLSHRGGDGRLIEVL